MGIQTAREKKQPGETLRYTMEYEPGVALAVGDSLTGTPTVKIYDRADDSDETATMLEGTPTMQDNIVYFFVKGGVTDESYNVSIKSDTVNGEKDVEEDLIIFVKKLS